MGVDEVVAAVLELGEKERDAVLAAVEAHEAVAAFEGAREAAGEPPCCPRCASVGATRRGRDGRGRQRWLCRGCGRSYTRDTGGVVSRSHLDERTWAAYARCFASEATLREAAEECGVCLKTSFFMRHRICEMLSVEGAAPLSTGPQDIVQADEAFLPKSCSGNHRRDPGFDMGRVFGNF